MRAERKQSEMYKLHQGVKNLSIWGGGAAENFLKMLYLIELDGLVRLG